MFRQLIVVGHGLIPTKDWEAMITYVRWADMLWQNRYTGLVGWWAPAARVHWCLAAYAGICRHM